jgi:N-methylhydantoinase A
LVKKAHELDIKTQILVMKSSGGLAYEDEVRRLPSSMIESGPAAGVIGAAFYGKLLGLENVLSFDMGGTTAKAGLVKKYAPEVVTEYEIGGQVHTGRVVKGSGYPVKFPFIDLSECSAGGGTIAWIDAGGALRVGPTSAGAEPGPACYGLGGEEPTITDANLVLGRLNPDYLLGGMLKINRDLSERAIRIKICDRLKLPLVYAAMGIIEIVNSTMSKILRIVSVERGYDPRNFTLIAYGGAGPMHACALAEDLGIQKIIVPVNPGLFSAFGMLAADFKYHASKPVMKDVSEVDVRRIEDAYAEMELSGITVFAEKHGLNDVSFIRSADLRYVGQAYELTIPAPKSFDRVGLSLLTQNFHDKHKSVYGYAVEEETVELINLRLEAVGVTAKPKIQKKISTGKEEKLAILNFRDVFYERSGKYVKNPIYIREKLEPGNVLKGPCVIEQYDATTLIHPNWRAVVDVLGNLIITRG